MRKRGKTDRNQTEIVQALRGVGCSVQSLASIGDGCPDLAVGRNGVNYFLECKDGEKSKSRQRLTGEQGEWISKWKGKVCVVATVKEALEAIGCELL